ncbi:P-loop containing nucleoside triphosphate hydrolase protein [Myxozyma melibiosi]|uniref:P-loop containing nucleoside triphosphate hydrolase protein n=1 Tax=Myxozyma melibiosi TaxID=54550 RepID=A0ABR1EZY6_9ASCO
MRPPSTAPLLSISSSRLNRNSEIVPGSSKISSAPTSRRSNSENVVAAKKKDQQQQSSSRPSSRCSNSSASDVARPSSRSLATASNNHPDAANKETNIHVVVRCRGRNDREVRENSGVVLDVQSAHEVTIQTGPIALSNKTYSFDHVFGAEADQSMVYDQVVAPILEETLSGYNCTIFAYGQTGTGKTYTMSGDVSDNYGTFANDAGIIPRVLYRMFLALEAEQSEYSVKCSFIELYNEELRDLISKDDDRKVKIFEDTAKKGIIIQGMEEAFIKNATEGLKLLQDGSHKRQVAATKCNDLSSRSHTVFTVTVHVKEVSSNGEEYLRIGKLNLVDLAGSENISRSGAENKRAREAGMINQSLLTLGRVINALVDRSSHIPYRESKLTRLLQDSLGGRTKTCIIATVSPAKMNMEETISTLDYASRAKSIRNKPQLNQVMSKKTLIKEYILEIERLKADLVACRQKNGVYITQESYQDITEESESRRILNEEQKRKIEVMETQLKTAREQLELTMKASLETKKELEMVSVELMDTQVSLDHTERDLVATKQSLNEEMNLRHAYEATELELSHTAETLMSTVNQAAADIMLLNNTIERKSELAETNLQVFTNSQKMVYDASRQFESRVSQFANVQRKYFESSGDKVRSMLVSETAKLGSVYKMIDDRLALFDQQQEDLEELMGSSKGEMNQVLENIKVLREDIKSKVGEGLEGLNNATEKISQELMNQIEIFQSQTSMAYNQLGREFKGMFDEFNKRLHTQRDELVTIHTAMASSSEGTLSKLDNHSASLRAKIEQEKKKAEEERQQILAQVSAMLKSVGEMQNERLEQSVAELCGEMTSTKNELTSAGQEFVAGGTEWLAKQKEFQKSITQDKERIKQTIIEAYHASEQSGDLLQQSTRSIHSEAVKIVGEQKENLAVQMQALDEFVTRARAQNETHHSGYEVAMTTLNSGVHDGLAAAKKLVEDTGRGLHVYAEDAHRDSEAAKEDVAKYAAESAGQYGALREAVLGLQMGEYASSGGTPKKEKAYFVPAKLPRTEVNAQRAPFAEIENEQQQQTRPSMLPRAST